jgi:hypothetical protein
LRGSAISDFHTLGERCTPRSRIPLEPYHWRLEKGMGVNPVIFVNDTVFFNDHL